VPLFLTLTGGKLSGSDRVRRISSGSLSIGRGADNGWVLPDPGRIVSSLHCIITAEDGRFVLTDLSANGIYINGAQQATARDSRIMLADGDQFRLGDYVINVAEVDDDPAGNINAGPGSTGDAPAFGGGFGGGRQNHDPLGGDPLDEPLARGPGFPFQHPIAHVPPKARPSDPFDGIKGKRPPRSIEPNDDLYHGLTPSSDWHGAPKPDHAPATQTSIPPPRFSLPAGEIDFDAYLGELAPKGGSASRPAAPAPPPEPPPAELPEVAERVRAAEPAPGVRTPDPVRQQSAAPGAAAGGSDARSALAAFLDGAGVAGQNIDDSDPEAALRAAGVIFRAMADGVREVLISRAAIKGEMRVTQTMIRAHGNNALKFSATPDDAVISLLTPKRPGYMEPLAAAKEAFTDIKSHELAVIAGMQNALLVLLRRFDPAALEERLTKGRLDAVLPAARKARYWDAFRLTYGEISREAEDDFQAAFGRSFANAYRALTNKGRTRND
jgi:type VI secretion system protein